MLSTHTHGGVRPGAGRKPVPVNESRIKSLKAQGFSHRTISDRLDIPLGSVSRIVAKLKKKEMQ